MCRLCVLDTRAKISKVVRLLTTILLCYSRLGQFVYEISPHPPSLETLSILISHPIYPFTLPATSKELPLMIHDNNSSLRILMDLITIRILPLPLDMPIQVCRTIESLKSIPLNLSMCPLITQSQHQCTTTPKQSSNRRRNERSKGTPIITIKPLLQQNELRAIKCIPEINRSKDKHSEDSA